MQETRTTQVSITKVLSDFTDVNVAETDTEVSVTCPFHDDTSQNSLRIYPETNTAYCFGGCGSFSPTRIVAKIEGITTEEAKSQLEVQYQLRVLTAEEETELYRQNHLLPYLEKAHGLLTTDHRALLHARGLTDEHIDKLKIGYHAEDFDEAFDNTLEQMGVYFKDANGDYLSDFVGKIVIPLYRRNKLISVCAWDPTGEPKYMYPKGQSKPLCGNVTNGAVLVEGIFDLLVLEQAGFKAMSTLGAVATNAQLQELDQLKEFSIAFDGDSAGEKGAITIATDIYPRAKLIFLEQGQDPNSIAVTKGEIFGHHFEDLLSNAHDLLDIYLEEMTTHSTNRLAASYFYDNCIPLLGKLNEVEADAVLADWDKQLKSKGIKKSSITKELQRVVKNSGTNGTSGTGNAGNPPSKLTTLYDTLAPTIPLYMDQVNDAYAEITTTEGKKLVKVNSTEFGYYIRQQARAILESEILRSDIVNSLKAEFASVAYISGIKVNLQNRVSWQGDTIGYDMADDQGTTILITKENWKLGLASPPMFRREAHQLPQVTPVENGSIQEFLNLFFLTDDQKILLAVWMVYALIPDVPKPILYVQAEKGSGKSDLTKAIRAILDPSSVPSLKEPNVEDRLISQLYHHYVPLFDNINTMTDWFIRTCCTTATGESDERRKLFTDDDVFILSFTRPIIINAINRLAIDYPDFQDRMVLLQLARISPNNRVEGATLAKKIDELKPQVFGAILDALSRAMQIKPTVKLPGLPRMADFAVWGCAIAEALGYSQARFKQVYSNNIEDVNEAVIYEHVLAHAIYEFMCDKHSWSGRSSDLLGELQKTAITEGIDMKDPSFPRSPNVLTRKIPEIQSNLKEKGINVTLPIQRGGVRTMEITNANVPKPVLPKVSSPASLPLNGEI